MTVDWSEAPEWAQELGENPAREKAWLGECGYSYLIGNGGIVAWEDPRAFLRSNFDIIEARPVAWNGEGKPPVGAVCDLRVGREAKDEGWMHAEIRYSSPTAVVWRWKGRVQEFGSEWVEVEVRPIRTPEQIAAEERKLQREQLAYLIAGYMGFDDPREVDTKLAAYIFDHDYRKQVTP